MNDEQLTRAERYQTSTLLKAGCSQFGITVILSRDQSTVSRECKRNNGLRGYRPKQPRRLTDEHRQSKGHYQITDTVWRHVEQWLRQDWSPHCVFSIAVTAGCERGGVNTS